MTIARVHDPLSLTLVRRLGDTGGPRHDQVGAELDSIITGVNNIENATTRIIGVRYNINVDTSTVGNVGGGLDSLHSFSLPANSLATNEDYVVVRYTGSYANTANTKRIQATFDGQVAVNSGLFAIQARAWLLDIMYVRVDSTHVRASIIYMLGNITRDSAGTVSGNGDFSSGDNLLTVSNLNSNAVTLLMQGESGGAATDDVVQHLSVIELVQF